ncbi:hypothetical protein PMNALOAF_2776 [Methylobacterium adhaesivum]|uniref:Uncharacterized protein n=1 Tax=Methylobacterium adhaesivum TaxID=333297 RepID=A0ABT8BJ12_9HYPH|nr:hypothetical protein [Methylobacterium adhaesivum]MDN3592129.1 hypothetical protein [Methylobacterium adhaesivum]GJD31517.1 hypothetical protein PMNALOAF_2776 [Methylobacterium adhaesivum]
MDKVWYKSKTILAAVFFALVGLADVLGAIDLKPLLLMLGVPAEKTEGVTLMLTVVFGLLRVATSGSVTARREGEP